MISAFFYGTFFAFGLILPLGPQNMFVLTQGMTQHRKAAISAVVATAALCDTLLIITAGLGLTLITFKFVWIKRLLLVSGILFMLYLGWQSWRQPSTSYTGEINETKNKSIFSLIFITIALSLLNPYALLDTVVTIGSVSLTYQHLDRIIFLSACILTSWLWFTFLAIAGDWLNKLEWLRLHQNKLSSCIMWIASIYLLYIACSTF